MQVSQLMHAIWLLLFYRKVKEKRNCENASDAKLKPNQAQIENPGVCTVTVKMIMKKKAWMLLLALHLENLHAERKKMPFKSRKFLNLISLQVRLFSDFLMLTFEFTSNKL